jgi:hypothetical protein
MNLKAAGVVDHNALPNFTTTMKNRIEIVTIHLAKLLAN